ncbi:ROK family protein [Bacillus sp. JJ1533]|uniref:ROK family protein n=1 Tax=Bacillus sp. JJ1533 TaxID=3122959 RepID=UPI002FFD61BC
MKKYIAFDIGGTFVKCGIVDENAEILHSTKQKTPKTLDGLMDLIETYCLSFPDATGIAISSCGAVSNEGVVYGSSALPYIHGPNIKELVTERTKLPVFHENDANCAGYAEVWKGAAKGKKDVMVMVIGTGIGGSIFKDGLLHKGANLHGGEFGYMLLTTNFSDSNDVWARTASTKALVRKVAKAKQLNPEELSGEEIFSMAESGDEDCIKAVDEFYHLLAVGIYNLQFIYDPEIILIGGGISARDDLIVNIDKKLDAIVSAIDLAKIKPKIAACELRQNANLLGAVYGLMKMQKK